MVGDAQHAVLVGSPDIRHPFYRHTVTQQLVLWDVGEKLRPWRSSMFGFNVFWDSDLLDNFPKLYRLGGAGGWMGLQISAFHPLIGFIVVADVAQRHSVAPSVDDDLEVQVNADRPEIGVFRAGDPVQAMGRLAAFCCSLDSRAKLEANVLVMRNYIGVPET